MFVEKLCLRVRKSFRQRTLLEFIFQKQDVQRLNHVILISLYIIADGLSRA